MARDEMVDRADVSCILIQQGYSDGVAGFLDKVFGDNQYIPAGALVDQFFHLFAYGTLTPEE